MSNRNVVRASAPALARRPARLALLAAARAEPWLRPFRWQIALAGSLAIAALSALVVAPAPSYDPWSWLLWGREVAGGGLDTEEGPAFKPLPVAVCAVLSPLGEAAPVAWVLLARAGAVLGIWLAFRLARELAGGSLTAGATAAVAVALCGDYLAYAGSGVVTGGMLALVLGAVEAWRRGRHRTALGCLTACALLHVESWPFLLGLGAVLWRRRLERPGVLAVVAVCVPAAWLVPELLGSGDLLRSAERAQIPNPGQPALAEVPALASLGQAAALPLWPVWIGAAAVALGGRDGERPALLLAAAGVAWIGLVAAMAEAGFSGEPRYALPGAALICIAGAVGLATVVPRPAGALAGFAVAAALLVAALPRLGELSTLPARQAYQWTLASDLATAVEAAGGREAILACGTPYVGAQRGPLMAYRLAVAKYVVEPDLPPRPAGVVFRSRLTAASKVAPSAPPAFAPLARRGPWAVLAACPARVGVRVP